MSTPSDNNRDYREKANEDEKFSKLFKRAKKLFGLEDDPAQPKAEEVVSAVESMKKPPKTEGSERDTIFRNLLKGLYQDHEAAKEIAAGTAMEIDFSKLEDLDELSGHDLDPDSMRKATSSILQKKFQKMLRYFIHASQDPRQNAGEDVSDVMRHAKILGGAAILVAMKDLLKHHPELIDKIQGWQKDLMPHKQKLNDLVDNVLKDMFHKISEHFQQAARQAIIHSDPNIAILAGTFEMLAKDYDHLSKSDSKTMQSAAGMGRDAVFTEHGGGKMGENLLASAGISDATLAPSAFMVANQEQLASNLEHSHAARARSSQQSSGISI